MSALPMTVGANDIALFNLSHQRFTRRARHVTQYKRFCLPLTMIKVHHVVGVLNAAIYARAQFRRADYRAVSRSSARVTIKILTLITLVMTARKITPALFAIGVTLTERHVSEIKLAGQLGRFTLRTCFIVRRVRVCEFYFHALILSCRRQNK
jgi:hypothetical protein